MKRFVGDHFAFLRQFRETFETTGALAPSSRFLARAMTRPIAGRSRPARILEIGPGTGAVTRRIVRLLGPDDHFELVELNSEFVKILNRRFQEESDFRAVADRTSLHQCPIQEFAAAEPFDFIVSGLPLNNFPPALVEDIFGVYFRLLAPGGVLSYFEYMYVRPLRRLVSKEPERQRLRHLDGVLLPRLGQHRIRRDWVFANLPPAWVQHLQHAPDRATPPPTC
jgi:phospholipid N-methyltransferase